MRSISEMQRTVEPLGAFKDGRISKRGLFKLGARTVVAGAATAAGIVLLRSEKAKASDVIPVTSPWEAGQLFGLSPETQDPSHWRINEFGGADFMGTGDGRHHLLLLNGAEMEGWTQIRRADGRDTSPFVALRNVKKVLANSGTLWRYIDAGAGWNKLVFDNAIKYPNDALVTMRFAYQTVASDITVTPVGSPSEAADKFGIYAETKDPGRWRINPDGGAEFMGTGDGRHHPLYLNGAEMEGWTQVKRADGADASPFVALRGRRVYAISGTLWQGNEQESNWQNLVNKSIAFQNANYPTNLLVPIRN